jgi:heterodisulfide reductase subunit A2
VKDEYGYGKLENVVTSMDFERLLCATGPYEGEILRASDKKHPHKIAWIQCVGSRRVPRAKTAIVQPCAAPTPRNR